MKKLKGLLLLVLMVCLTTGCVKHNVTMEVKNNKEVTLEVMYGMEIEASLSDDSVEGGVSKDDYKFLEKEGFKVEAFSEKKDDKTVAGVKITKTFKNIDDITADKKSTFNMVEAFDEENASKIKDLKYFYKDGSKYVVNFNFDYSNESDDMDYSSYESMFDLKFEMKLPSKAVSNNATNVDKNVYTWDLKFSKPNNIDLSFNLGSSCIVLIVGGVGALVAAAVVVVVIVLNKKKTTEPETTSKE